MRKNHVTAVRRGLAIESVDGGPIEDVTIDNITMRDISNAPIFIRRGNRARTPGEPPPGIVRRISISNVVASGVSGAHGILISGIPAFPIEDVRLSNIRVHYLGGGTKADSALQPEEKEKDYPEPDMFGRMPSYALFARHVIGLDGPTPTSPSSNRKRGPPLRSTTSFAWTWITSARRNPGRRRVRCCPPSTSQR